MDPLNVNVDEGTDVESVKFQRRWLHNFQTQQRVKNGEGLSGLRRVVVIASLLVGKVEARTHDGNAANAAGLKHAGFNQSLQLLIEVVVRPQVGVQRNAPFGIEFRQFRLSRGLDFFTVGIELVPHASEVIQKIFLDASTLRWSIERESFALEERSHFLHSRISRRGTQGAN